MKLLFPVTFNLTQDNMTNFLDLRKLTEEIIRPINHFIRMQP